MASIIDGDRRKPYDRPTFQPANMIMPCQALSTLPIDNLWAFELPGGRRTPKAVA